MSRLYPKFRIFCFWLKSYVIIYWIPGRQFVNITLPIFSPNDYFICWHKVTSSPCLSIFTGAWTQQGIVSSIKYLQRRRNVQPSLCCKLPAGNRAVGGRLPELSPSNSTATLLPPMPQTSYLQNVESNNSFWGRQPLGLLPWSPTPGAEISV